MRILCAFGRGVVNSGVQLVSGVSSAGNEWEMKSAPKNEFGNKKCAEMRRDFVVFRAIDTRFSKKKWYICICAFYNICFLFKK
jgi:hypothetical protein